MNEQEYCYSVIVESLDQSSQLIRGHKELFTDYEAAIQYARDSIDTNTRVQLINIADEEDLERT